MAVLHSGPEACSSTDKIRSSVASEAPQLRCLLDKDGLLIFADSSDRGLCFWSDADESLVVLGSLFDRQGNFLPNGFILDTPEGEPDPIDWLTRRYWGAYLALSFDEERREIGIGRDPGGALAVHVVNAPGLAVVTDQLPRWLHGAIGQPTPVNRPMLANALAMPLLTTYRSLLQSVEQVPAGGVLRWRDGAHRSRLAWQPASSWSGGSYDPQEMRGSVLAAVRGLAQVYPKILVELSGGLDSAIVLGALREVGGYEHVGAINLSTMYAGGDERGLARAAADKAGIELREFTARESDLDYAEVLEGPQPIQPNLYGLDPLIEGRVAEASLSSGSSAVLTGQGGDAVFFQVPTDKVAIDLMRAAGFGALLTPVAFDAARRTHRSIWSIQYAMLRDRICGTTPDRMPVSVRLLGSEARKVIDPKLGEHPWLEAATRLPPGKQTQMLTIANCQLYTGPTRRNQAARLRHPLMSQPVVEAWLAAPTFILSTGTQDRSLARMLFADFLPSAIARRRGKGEASIYYRRSLVENLNFLRDHLLEGTLEAHGMLDRHQLEDLLDEQALLSSEEARLVPSLASFESWARYWRL